MPATTFAPPIEIETGRLSQLAQALESGKYTLGTEALKCGTAYCVHGVFCAELGLVQRPYHQTIVDDDNNDVEFTGFVFESLMPHDTRHPEFSHVMPPEWWRIQRVGFDYDTLPEYLQSWQAAHWPHLSPSTTLTSMVDTGAYTFADMARVIREFVRSVQGGCIPQFTFNHRGLAHDPAYRSERAPLVVRDANVHLCRAEG